MPTRNVNLTDDQDAFVEMMVKTGKYQNASETVRDALRALQQRWKEDELKLTILRKQIKAGITALDRGDFTEVERCRSRRHPRQTRRGAVIGGAVSAIRTSQGRYRLHPSDERGEAWQGCTHPLSRASNCCVAPDCRDPGWRLDRRPQRNLRGIAKPPHTAKQNAEP